ncbi:MAG: hypothetical protein JNN00_16535 [Chitinophagaceae bacterium]|nr:hypothetical protein [Chitinophagaceae bacterium]
MKRAASVILLFIFSAQTFYYAGITCWFYINRGYVAKELCVNRSRPELKCNGKCFLAKKLKEAENRQQEQTPQQLKEWVETSPCTTAFVSFHFGFTKQKQEYSCYHADNYSFDPAHTFFHPPGYLS